MKPRILVVEDERAIQLALSGLLGRAGYAAEQRCMLLYGVEGSDARDVKSAVRRVRGIARKHGGAPLTRAPGKSSSSLKTSTSCRWIGRRLLRTKR